MDRGRPVLGSHWPVLAVSCPSCKAGAGGFCAGDSPCPNLGRNSNEREQQPPEALGGLPRYGTSAREFVRRPVKSFRYLALGEQDQGAINIVRELAATEEPGRLCESEERRAGESPRSLAS